ncbi:hypothetical protein ACFOLC_00225 [Lysobacter cavernae]|uniref:Uncharacterized protein n=1 Tax=Lysobacter cavernae TaxID=1685901 RepID=A0ABV7RIV6_9GAMM
MLRTIELAALPSTLQLCLQSADRCGGLIQTSPYCAYVPRHFHPREVGAAHTPADINALIDLRLLACIAVHNSIVRITDDGIELLNTGYTRSEVTP